MTDDPLYRWVCEQCVDAGAPDTKSHAAMDGYHHDSVRHRSATGEFRDVCRITACESAGNE